ncbi:recombinase family protein [Pseudodesulfovibrio indicus]|nr:recombinase family protein [Pseudodesulfovibrio indicus]
MSEIAKELNAQKIMTARGGKWHPSSVKRLLGAVNITQVSELNYGACA